MQKVASLPSKFYGENIMTNIAIFYCKKIKDHSCVGYAKCYKAIGESNDEFSRYEDINLVSYDGLRGFAGIVQGS